MTLEELSELLDVPRSRLYRLIGEHDPLKRLPAIKLRGKWFIERERVDEWLLRIWERSNRPKRGRKTRRVNGTAGALTRRN
jgi:excisionase family DNA binding protein